MPQLVHGQFGVVSGSSRKPNHPGITSWISSRRAQVTKIPAPTTAKTVPMGPAWPATRGHLGLVVRSVGGATAAKPAVASDA